MPGPTYVTRKGCGARRSREAIVGAQPHELAALAKLGLQWAQGGEVRAVVSTCFSRDPHPCRRLFVVLGAEHTGDAVSNLTNQGHPDISPGRSSGLAPGRTRPFEPVKHHPLRVECLLVRDRGGPEGTRARPRTEVPAGSGQLLEAGQHA